MFELDTLGEKLTRIVIIEKYIRPNYIDENGNKFWTNKYGEITKSEDKDGNPRWIPRTGSTFLDHGFIYAPYVTMFKSPGIYTTEMDESYFNPNEFKPSKKIKSRFAKKKINSKYYGKIEL